MYLMVITCDVAYIIQVLQPTQESSRTGKMDSSTVCGTKRKFVTREGISISGGNIKIAHNFHLPDRQEIKSRSRCPRQESTDEK